MPIAQLVIIPMRKDLVENALRHSRPGDILFLATESPESEPGEFLAAALALRNLMAFPAAVDVLDCALSLDGNNLRALEQKALCLSRQGLDYASEAERCWIRPSRWRHRIRTPPQAASRSRYLHD